MKLYMKDKKKIFGWVIAAVLSLVLYGNINQTGDIQQTLQSFTQVLQPSSNKTETGNETANITTPAVEQDTAKPDITKQDISEFPEIDLSAIPEFTDSPYYVMNDNIPYFAVSSDMTDSFEVYGELDELGRCTIVYANIGQDLMPTEQRGNISSVKPTGWKSVTYDFVDGKNLYNRCHLIGWQLTAENANKKNLITGTRYLNVDGMLPFENLMADYIKETGNHVLYRVTPIFEGDNLVAHGVLMEGWSVEDNGEGVCFNIFAYNNQPGVVIDYATGENWAADQNK